MGVTRLRNYIDGEWVESTTTEWAELRNPARDTVLAEAPMSTGAETDAAIEAAQAAYRDWRNTPPVARSRYLHRLIPLLEENFNEISMVQTREHGKTIDESRGETRRGIEMLEVAAGMPSLMQGFNLEDIAAGIDEYAINQPMGVFSCIAPYNFPFMVPLWFLPFAIACGNTFVVKSSPRTPMSQVELFKLLDEVGLPPGVVNLVNGATESANALMDHPHMQGVTFVGSTPVARQVYKRCGENGKRVIAQGGAKNYIVVMPDAEIDQAMVSLLSSFFGNSGQRCLAGANLLVVGGDAFYREVADKFVAAASAIRVGDGLGRIRSDGPRPEQGFQGPDHRHDRTRRVRRSQTGPGRPQIESGRGCSGYLLPESVRFRGYRTGTTPAPRTRFSGRWPASSAPPIWTRPCASSTVTPMATPLPYLPAAARPPDSSSMKWSPETWASTWVSSPPWPFSPSAAARIRFSVWSTARGRDVIRFFTEPKIVISRWF